MSQAISLLDRRDTRRALLGGIAVGLAIAGFGFAIATSNGFVPISSDQKTFNACIERSLVTAHSMHHQLDWIQARASCTREVISQK